MLQLFITFFKIGLFTFGGGYAMLPLLQDEVVRRHHWASEEELLDYYAVGQSTPGIISVNVATFIGYKLYGVLGACLATLAIILPSFIIITSIAAILDVYMQNPYLTHAFAGIRIVVVALIAATVWDLWQKSVNCKLGYIIFALSFISVLFLNVSAVIVVVSAGLLGFAKYKISGLNKKGGK